MNSETNMKKIIIATKNENTKVSLHSPLEDITSIVNQLELLGYTVVVYLGDRTFQYK